MTGHDREADADDSPSRPGDLLLAFASADAPGGPEWHAGVLERAARGRPGPSEVVVVRDREGAGFFRGAEGLGESIDEAAAALGSMIAGRAAGRVVAFGVGAGGHAALVFGALLGADRIVAVEPPAHLDIDELALYNDRRWPGVLSALPDPELARRYDAAALLGRAGFAGRAYVLFGTLRENAHHDAVHQNAIHAHRLARSRRVTLCPFPEAGQGLLACWERRGELEARLAHHLFGDVEPPPHERAVPPPDGERLRIVAKLHQPLIYAVCVPDDADAGGKGDAAAAFAAAGEVDPSATQKISDEWRRWIAGNLMLGASPVSLEDLLVGSGFSDQEAAREVWNAMQSPYLWGAQRLQNRLKKRDWLLAAYRKLRRIRPGSAEVGRRHGLTPDDLLRTYYAANAPVILTGMLEGWPALSSWSPEALSRRFGDRAVEVEIARDTDLKEAGRTVEARSMPIAEFAAILGRDPTPDDILEADGMLAQDDNLDEHDMLGEDDNLNEDDMLGEDDMLAMDDVLAMGNMLGADGMLAAGDVPAAEETSLTAGEGSANQSTLAELWDDLGPLPGYLDGRGTAAGSIRLASAGSILPFRLSLANALLAQVAGRARVKLAPSWDLPLMRNSSHVHSQLDGRTTPAAPRVLPGEPEPQVLEFVLEPGEVLFVPVGYWSFVEGLAATAAVTFENLAFDNDFAEHYPGDTAS